MDTCIPGFNFCEACVIVLIVMEGDVCQPALSVLFDGDQAVFVTATSALKEAKMSKESLRANVHSTALGLSLPLSFREVLNTLFLCTFDLECLFAWLNTLTQSRWMLIDLASRSQPLIEIRSVDYSNEILLPNQSRTSMSPAG